MSTAHLNCVLPRIAQTCSKKSGTLSPQFDPILFQLAVPVQHQHVECHLAATVSNGLEVNLLGLSGWLSWRWEILHGCLVDVREAGYKDESWLD